MRAEKKFTVYEIMFKISKVRKMSISINVLGLFSDDLQYIVYVFAVAYKAEPFYGSSTVHKLSS